MTGAQMLDKALVMLGYSNTNGNLISRIKDRSLTFINLVYSDIWYILKEEDFTPLSTLKDKIDLTDRVLQDVFPYGLCMFIAQSESDSDNQALWTNLYNQKRTSLTRLDTVKDVIPTVY